MTLPDPYRDGGGLPAAQRRLLTILFSDLTGYTSLTESFEPEDLLGVVDHLKRCARRVIADHRGVIVSYHGDGIMAMFGYPEPSEYDGRRAVAAALALHQRFHDEPVTGSERQLPPLRLHTGIHCEHVVIRREESGQYTLAGQAAPIAQRLSDLAHPGEIVASKTTLGGDSSFFDVLDRGLVALKGKVHPVDAIQVRGLSSARNRFEARTQRGASPFVGRARELDALDRHLHEMLAGHSREVAIVASPGLGKTRFVEEFLHGIPRGALRVCRGYCETYLAAEPLQPFLQILRHVVRRELGAGAAETESGVAAAERPGESLATTLAGLQRAVSIRFPTTTSTPATVDGAAAWLCSVFAAMARESPVVLFVDDWQWADDATRQVMARIREMHLPSLLILTAARERVPQTRRSEVRAIALGPLDHEETDTVIESLLPEADPLLTEQIHHLSGGNPLFIEELCHGAASLSTRRSSDPGESVPAWLSTLIESRVGRLSPDLQRLVHVAAVIGAAIPTWLLQEVTGHASGDAVFARLVKEDLIYPSGDATGMLAFKHGITRDVIYRSIGLLERRALHQHIGSILEQRRETRPDDAPLEALSYHFRATLDTERATRFAEMAGDKAMRSGAADRARVQYKYVLDTLSPAGNYPRWRSVANRLGSVCIFDPSRQHIPDFHRAASLARGHNDERGIARAEYWLGFIHYTIGDSVDAIEHYERARVHCARAIAGERPTEERTSSGEMEALQIELLATIGQARAAAGEHQPALALLDDALTVKRTQRRGTGPAVGLAYDLSCKGAVLGDLGRFAEAHDCFDEALDAIRAGHPAVEASVFGWRSAVYLWQGRWEDARESATRAQKLAERIGSLYVLAMDQAVAAYATWILEGAPEAREIIARATSWLEARDKRLSISLAYGWMADIDAATGNAAAARADAAKAIRRARVRDTFGEPMSYRALATLPWRGRGMSPDDYLMLATTSSNRRSPREDAVTLLHRGKHAARAGQAADALALLEQARTAFIGMGMSWFDRQAEGCISELSLQVAGRKSSAVSGPEGYSAIPESPSARPTSPL